MSKIPQLPKFSKALKNMDADLVAPRLPYIEMPDSDFTIDVEALRDGIVIDPANIQNLETRGAEQLLCYKGNQIILYIDRPKRSQEAILEDRLGAPPRLHFKRCQTLINMDAQDGQGTYTHADGTKYSRYEERYIMTNNPSGVYNLIPLDPYTGTHLEEGKFETWLPACRHCLKELNYDNYSTLYSKEQKEQFIKNFNVLQFFEHYGPYFEREDYRRLKRKPYDDGNI